MPVIALALSLMVASTGMAAESVEAPVAPPRCATVPEAPACRDTPHGVIVGPTEGGGEAAVAAAAEEAVMAEQAWTSIFGIAPPPYAVVLDQALPSETLGTAGALRVLPWMSLSARRTMMEQGIRDAVARQAPASQVEALTAAALLQAAPQIQVSLDKSGQPGVMAHELGHYWYILGFWAGAPQGADRYGSPAPDWLDEAAAVLMERDAMTEARRAAFHRDWARAPRPTAVSDLMAEVHPTFASGALATLTDGTASSSGPVVMMMSGEEFQRRTGTDIGAAAAFYTRVRAFLDFVEDKTGNHEAIVRLTVHLRAGGTIPDWFNKDPAGLEMGGSAAEADSAFKAWADATIAAPT